MNRFAEGMRFGAIVALSDYRLGMHRLSSRPMGDLQQRVM